MKEEKPRVNEGSVYYNLVIGYDALRGVAIYATNATVAV